MERRQGEQPDVGGDEHGSLERVCWILVWTNRRVKGFPGVAPDASRSAAAWGTVE
jgi:hypothetical protein